MTVPPTSSARDAFVRIALEEPSPGQLMRALEMLAEHLQQGHVWDGFADRLADLERLAERRTAEAMQEPSRETNHEVAAMTLMELMREEGFDGAGPVYETVENSFIDRVFETGHGLPITLSAVAIHLAQRCGIDLQGIGFPGHFLVGVNLAGRCPMILDPFGGGHAVPFSDLALIYTRATGRHLTASAPMLRDALAPTSNRAILVRVLNNLHQHYLQRGAQDRAAEVVELLLAFHPRGVALRKLASRLGRRVRTLN